MTRQTHGYSECRVGHARDDRGYRLALADEGRRRRPEEEVRAGGASVSPPSSRRQGRVQCLPSVVLCSRGLVPFVVETVAVGGHEGASDVGGHEGASDVPVR